MSSTTTTKPGRLLSLDVLRGFTIAGMILVNNPGSWQYVYAPLRHAQWHGLTPTDLVFPFFMFIMGVSMYLSYRKFDFKLTKQTFWKFTRRSVLLFLIGLILGWFGLFCRELNQLNGVNMPLGEKILQAATQFENIRNFRCFTTSCVSFIFWNLDYTISSSKTHSLAYWFYFIVLLDPVRLYS